MFNIPAYIKYKKEVEPNIVWLPEKEEEPKKEEKKKKEKKKKKRERVKPENYHIAIELAGSKCEICGSTKRLTIHHKDGNHDNNELDNLMVLCWFPCHLKIHNPKFKTRLENGEIDLTKYKFYNNKWKRIEEENYRAEFYPE